MKISLDWLSDYIKLDLSADEIAEVLSDLGFPCEGMETHGDDTVIDVEITSNRGDCLGYLGIARELSAVTGEPFGLSDFELSESDEKAEDIVDIQIDEPQLCGRYTGRVIRGVRVGPSCDWVVKRLESLGLRSVNNVVDATNYAMIETGQPPHAFDMAKITDNKIIVRKASAGEQIVSIDGSRCQLKDNMLIIADSKMPVAVAGVMGGLDSEVSEQTVDVLLEDAYFDPVTVRRTSRELALPSEAAYRFERIVDIEMIDRASKRTAWLITKLAGGKVAKGVVDAYPEKPRQRKVSLRLERLKKVLGIEIAAEKVEDIFSRLKFEPRREDGRILCRVPSWRSDVYREADLIEEVARVHGYARIPTESKLSIEVAPVDGRHKLTESIGRHFNSCGFYEAVTVSFTDDKSVELFEPGIAEKLPAVKDVSRKSDNLLRPSLLGSLLSVLKTNVNARNLPCRVFEIADTYSPSEGNDRLPAESEKVSLVCDSDFRILKGAIEGLLGDLNRELKVEFEPTELHWAEAAAIIRAGGREIGCIGMFNDTVCERYDFKEVKPCGAEIELAALGQLRREAVQIESIPKFPAIQRDLSLIVNEQTLWKDVEETIQSNAPGILQNVEFVETYRGKGISGGKKSVTLSLEFRDDDGTLTHEVVDGYEKPIVEALSRRLGAELRSA